MIATAANAKPEAIGGESATAALERAFSAKRAPSIMLALAEVHAGDPARCNDRIDAHRRFFEACDDCPSLSHGIARTRAALAECHGHLDGAYGLCAALDLPGVIPEAGTMGPRQVIGLVHYHVRHGEEVVARRLATAIAYRSADMSVSKWKAIHQMAERYLIDRRGPREAAFILEYRRQKHASFTDLVEVLQFAASTEGAAKRKARCELTAALAPRLKSMRTPERWGLMTIATSPYTDVFVDGVAVGQTPLASVRVTAGSHQLRAVHPETGRKLEGRIEIEPNASSRYKVTLEDGRLAFNALD